MDVHRKDLRCRAKKMIRNRVGIITPLTEGTIAFEMDNLGRHLIHVRWDNGLTTYVFPEEIEIIDKDGSPANPG